jgi:predicted DNA-binding transcriptional regulator AlpA
MRDRPSSHTKSGLPRYVGEAEVREALGVSRSTLHRMRTDGDFPPPDRLSTNRVAWKLDTVLDWMAVRDRVRDGKLAAAAVSDPTKLAPEDVDTAIAALGARLASAQSGRAVSPDEIAGVTVRLSPEETAAAVERQWLRELACFFAACARLDPIRASLVAAGLLPAIRDEMRKLLEARTGREVIETDEQLMALAADILDQAARGEFVGPT